jgi:hypothetical protein
MTFEDWFWEGNVQEMLADHLESEGWEVLLKSDSRRRSQGYDLLVMKGSRRLAIEVKGYPSTEYRDPAKQGKTKPTQPQTQARHWFSHALLSAFSYYRTTDHEVAVAFPDFGTYQNLLEKTRRGFEQLGIGAFFVREDGCVYSAIEHRERLSARTKPA